MNVFLWQHAEAGEERNVQKPTDREVAVVLDTALVQALLSTDNLSTALQLLSGPNYADVGACEDVMLEGKSIVMDEFDYLMKPGQISFELLGCLLIFHGPSYRRFLNTSVDSIYHFVLRSWSG